MVGGVAFLVSVLAALAVPAGADRGFDSSGVKLPFASHLTTGACAPIGGAVSSDSFAFIKSNPDGTITAQIDIHEAASAAGTVNLLQRNEFGVCGPTAGSAVTTNSQGNAHVTLTAPQSGSEASVVLFLAGCEDCGPNVEETPFIQTAP
jgi:hypothetical protein